MCALCPGSEFSKDRGGKKSLALEAAGRFFRGKRFDPVKHMGVIEPPNSAVLNPGPGEPQGAPASVVTQQINESS